MSDNSMARRIIKSMLFPAFLLAHPIAVAQNWHPVGPFTAPWSMCFSRERILFGTYQAGIVRSTDNGLRWAFAAGMPPVAYGVLPSNIVSCVKSDPRDPNIVYAGVGIDNTATGHGFFKSSDGGQTWHVKNTGLPQWPAVNDIAPNPFHRGELFIDVRSDAAPGIYRSTDAGESWSLFFQNSYLYSSIIFDLSDSTVQYLPGADGTVNTWTQGIYSALPSSTNFFGKGGPVATLLSPGYRSLFYVCRNSLYKCARDGNWIALLDSVQSGGIKIGYICAAAVDQVHGAVLVSADCGVLRSTDDGGHWAMVAPMEDMNICVDSTRAMCAGYSGLFASTNGGTLWSRIADGPSIGKLIDISRAPYTGGDAMYAIAGNPFSVGQSLFKSTNNGLAWDKLRLPGKPSPTVVKANPLNANTVYAGCGDFYTNNLGLYRSSDGGRSWKQMLPDSTTPVTAIDIPNTDTARVLLGCPGTVWESSNSGATWKVLVGMNDSHFETNVVKYSGAHTSTILAGMSCNDETLAGLFLTADSGRTWERRVNGLAEGLSYKNVTAIAVSPVSDSVVYLGNWSSLSMSLNQGLLWQDCTFTHFLYQEYVDDIQVAPDNPAVICSAVRGIQVGEGGLYLSTNEGGTWDELPFPGTTDKSRTKVIIQPDGDKYVLHVGTLSYGWYEGEIPRLLTSTGPHGSVPIATALFQNYPNPFNPGTTIRYALSRESFVTLAVYNTLGQRVRTLVQESQSTGNHEVTFDGSNLASGVYVYRLQAGSYVHTRKLLLLR